ncbi:MAG: glutamate-cysteine ligase family protein [Bacteriovoracaceae bacterium]
MNGFRFGLEAEFLLANNIDWRPLWYKDVTFKQLDQIFKSISLEGIPSLDGLAAEPPHDKLMPFIVEGYGIPDANFNITDAYPKGIEIRTPVCHSLEEVMAVYEELFKRVKTALATQNLAPIAISHHPTESKFSGPQNKRRHDFWQWAMEVMTTFGPDINVSFPSDITQKLFQNVEDLEAKVNYYAPAMAAISLASPFYEGQVWHTKNKAGKSYRTFKRSVVAPAIELHPDENFRIEFKVFEMTKNSADFKNYFLLVLALFLDESLNGRASKQERVYDLGQVAMYGLEAPFMKERLVELYQKSFSILKKFGFNPSSLTELETRIEKNLTPSDKMIEIFNQHHSINEVLKNYSVLKTLNGDII